MKQINQNNLILKFILIDLVSVTREQHIWLIILKKEERKIDGTYVYETMLYIKS